MVTMLSDIYVCDHLTSTGVSKSRFAEQSIVITMTCVSFSIGTAVNLLLPTPVCVSQHQIVPIYLKYIQLLSNVPQ